MTAYSYSDQVGLVLNRFMQDGYMASLWLQEPKDPGSEASVPGIFRAEFQELRCFGERVAVFLGTVPGFLETSQSVSRRVASEYFSRISWPIPPIPGNKHSSWACESLGRPVARDRVFAPRKELSRSWGRLACLWECE
jgi:hypothetical protein